MWAIKIASSEQSKTVMDPSSSARLCYLVGLASAHVRVASTVPVDRSYSISDWEVCMITSTHVDLAELRFGIIYLFRTLAGIF